MPVRASQRCEAVCQYRRSDDQWGTKGQFGECTFASQDETGGDDGSESPHEGGIPAQGPSQRESLRLLRLAGQCGRA